MGDKKLTILHFNDVYNIEEQKMEPAGGAARMAHYVKSQKEDNPMVLFSGDALSPSLSKSFSKLLVLILDIILIFFRILP